jgi:hypothetical protein
MATRMALASSFKTYGALVTGPAARPTAASETPSLGLAEVRPQSSSSRHAVRASLARVSPAGDAAVVQVEKVSGSA